ncbi:MAG TPA: hypothetical protein VNR67_00525 [Solirubrobacterales bacterium]|nr:hypothetical protein [Solirubrobacterales bacterium]
MSTPEPSDARFEIGDRRFVEMTDGTLAEVSTLPGSLTRWLEKDDFGFELKTPSPSPAQSGLFEPMHSISDVEETIEDLTRRFASPSARRSGSPYRLLTAAAAAGKSGEDTRSENERKQLQEIREALEKSKRLGESSERRLEALRRRNRPN